MLFQTDSLDETSAAVTCLDLFVRLATEREKGITVTSFIRGLCVERKS